MARAPRKSKAAAKATTATKPNDADTLKAGSGADSLEGGAGNDSVNAQAATEKKPETTKAKSKSAKQVPGIFVRSRPRKFYRAGLKFDATGYGIALDALTEDELEAIRQEPQLIVEDCMVDPADIVPGDSE